LTDADEYLDTTGTACVWHVRGGVHRHGLLE
jgi:hypothetical protein